MQGKAGLGDVEKYPVHIDMEFTKIITIWAGSLYNIDILCCGFTTIPASGTRRAGLTIQSSVHTRIILVVQYKGITTAQRGSMSQSPLTFRVW